LPKWIADPKTILGDAQLARLPDKAQLLYLKLRIWGDAEHRCYANLQTIKGALFPHDEAMTPDVLAECLRLLRNKRYIRFYQADGEDYLVVQKHMIEFSKKASADLPDPPAGYYAADYRPSYIEASAEPPVNSVCCLLQQSDGALQQLYRLKRADAKTIIGAYCELRHTRNTCSENQGDCHADIMFVVNKAKAHNPTDWPSYLRTSLMDDLGRIDDEWQQQRATQAKRRT